MGVSRTGLGRRAHIPAGSQDSLQASSGIEFSTYCGVSTPESLRGRKLGFPIFPKSFIIVCSSIALTESHRRNDIEFTQGVHMDLLHVRDGSEEVRVEVCGSLSGSLVEQLRTTWQNSQSTEFWRRFVVDISNLTGYDREGHQLLNQLHQHGVIFAAATPNSLGFLEEITTGIATRSALTALRRAADRASSPRPRHKAGIGTYETHARSR